MVIEDLLTKSVVILQMETLVTLFKNPVVAILGFFCSVVVSSFQAMTGGVTKLSKGLAVGGFVWFVSAIFLNL